MRKSSAILNNWLYMGEIWNGHAAMKICSYGLIRMRRYTHPCRLWQMRLAFNAAAITSGIGRTRENIYGYMDEEGVYQRRSLSDPPELVSLSGNIARTEDGKAFTHIHCCWSDDDNNVHAGHMFQSKVHVVAEIHIRVLSKAIMTRCPLADLELLGLQFS